MVVGGNDRFSSRLREETVATEDEVSVNLQSTSEQYRWYVRYSNDRFSSQGDIIDDEYTLDHQEKLATHPRTSADLIVHCSLCNTNSLLEAHHLSTKYDDIMYIDPVRKRVKSVIFTDCANAYSSVSSITAGSMDKSMRLHLAYIRDNASTNILSFCDAIFNLSDLGTKLGASAVNWRKFLQFGVFHVSFIGGKASIALFRKEEGEKSRSQKE